MEIIPVVKGCYHDILKDKYGNIIYDSGWTSNIIVDTCRKLLAAFMKNDSPLGIQYLAVGSGEKSWDSDGLPLPDKEKEGLVHPFTPAIPSDDPPSELILIYLDEIYDTEVAGPTRRLQITATLGPGYPAPDPPLSTYPLREFGLFGYFNNEPYMINYKAHPVIHKDESATLIREIKLSF